jgi:hypothetical protein
MFKQNFPPCLTVLVHNTISIKVDCFIYTINMSFAGMAPQGHFLKWNQDADPLPYKKKPRLLNREESSV